MNCRVVTIFAFFMVFLGTASANISDPTLSDDYVQSETPLDFSTTIDESSKNVTSIYITEDGEEHTLTDDNGDSIYDTTFDAPSTEGDYSADLTVEYENSTTQTSSETFTVSDSVGFTNYNLENQEAVDDTSMVMSGDTVQLEVDPDTDRIASVSTDSGQTLQDSDSDGIYTYSYDYSEGDSLAFTVTVEDEAGNNETVTTDSLTVNQVPELNNPQYNIDFNGDSTFTVDLDDKGQGIQSVSDGTRNNGTITVENQNGFTLTVEDSYGETVTHEVSVNKDDLALESTGEHTVDSQTVTQDITITNNGDGMEILATDSSFENNHVVLNTISEDQLRLISSAGQSTYTTEYEVDMIDLSRGDLKIDDSFSNTVDNQKITRVDNLTMVDSDGNQASPVTMDVSVDGNHEEFGSQVVSVSGQDQTTFSKTGDWVNRTDNSTQITQDNSKQSTQDKQYYTETEYITLESSLGISEFDVEVCGEKITVDGTQYECTQNDYSEDNVVVEDSGLMEGDFDHTIDEQEVIQTLNLTNNATIELTIDVVPPLSFEDEYGESEITIASEDTETETYAKSGDWLKVEDGGISNKIDVAFSSVDYQGQDIDVPAGESTDISGKLSMVGNFFGSPTGVIASLIVLFAMGFLFFVRM